MKQLIIITLVSILSGTTFSQNVSIYGQTRFGSTLVGSIATDPISRASTLYSPNDMGRWEPVSTSIPSPFVSGGSTEYKLDNYGSPYINSITAPGLGGGATIYTRNNLGDFAPNIAISPNYGGTYSIYSRGQSGQMELTGSYNSRNGTGSISLPAQSSRLMTGSPNDLPGISNLPGAASMPRIRF